LGYILKLQEAMEYRVRSMGLKSLQKVFPRLCTDRGLLLMGKLLLSYLVSISYKSFLCTAKTEFTSRSSHIESLLINENNRGVHFGRSNNNAIEESGTRNGMEQRTTHANKTNIWIVGRCADWTHMARRDWVMGIDQCMYHYRLS
jgi:hypothetical protein